MQCCDSCSDNCCVYTFCCGPMSNTVILLLISVTIYLHLVILSNRRIASTQMSSDCTILLTSLFQSDRNTSFKLWHVFVLCKNPFVGHCYSRCKVIAQSKCNRNFDHKIENYFLYVPAKCAVLMWQSPVIHLSNTKF